MAIAYFIQVPVPTQLRSENNLFGFNLEDKSCGSMKKERSNGRNVQFQHFRLHFVEGSLLTFLL